MPALYCSSASIWLGTSLESTWIVLGILAGFQWITVSTSGKIYECFLGSSGSNPKLFMIFFLIFF